MFIIFVLLLCCCWDVARAIYQKGCEEESKNKLTDVTLLILVFKNPKTLEHTLDSYLEKCLFDVTYEANVFFQEIDAIQLDSVNKYPVNVLGTKQNSYIASGMRILFASVQTEYALFLEKDFSIEIPRVEVLPQMLLAYHTLQSENANIYHMRSRTKAGEPNWAAHMQGKEEELVAANHSHTCCFATWISNVTERFPNAFKKCNTTVNGQHSICISSKLCNWTNNPFMVSMHFYHKVLDPLLHHLQYKFKSTSHMTPLEREMNLVEPYLTPIWRTLNFTVGFHDGLFTHFEIDGR